MIKNKIWSRRLAILILLLLTAVAACGPPRRPIGGPIDTPTASALLAQVAHDEATVAATYHNCDALHLSPSHCPFKTATTSNGSGGGLIAIDLTQQTGDDCYRGKVFFFNGESLVADTKGLAPHSKGGVESVRAAGSAAFAVTFGTSPSTSTSCAQNGSAGPDVYRYTWDGTNMAKKSGTPPTPPKVIVGT
jgi:hypothetical protein